MPAEQVLAIILFALFKVMNEGEWSNLIAIFYNGNVCLLVPGAFEDVVIAFYKNDVQVFNIGAPFQEHVQFFVGVTVKEIAYNYELFRFEELQQVHEALHVFFINRLGNCDAGFAEMAGFTKMQVGNDQCFLFFPKDAAVWAQAEGLVSHSMFQQGIHGFAKIHPDRCS